MTKWEYLVVPLKDAASLKKDSNGLTPDRLNALGSEGWEAVGVSLKQGDLIAWPVVFAQASGGVERRRHLEAPPRIRDDLETVGRREGRT